MKQKIIQEKELYGFIKYLLDDYKIEFDLKHLYDFIEGYSKFNYLDSKIIVKFLKQKVGLLNWRDYEIKGNTLIFYKIRKS